MYKILVINTGSTSTKIAVFEDSDCVLKDNLFMSEDVLKACEKTVDQLPFREKIIRDWLDKYGYKTEDFNMISARGGPLPPVQGGAYKVNRLMLDVLTYAPASRHESALSCMLAADLAKGTDVPAIIYDSVGTDEMRKVAKYTGRPELKNRAGGHVLNSRRVCRITAAKLGKEYKDCSFVVAHLGGSITVTAHEGGKIVDKIGAYNGPMSTQRAGKIATDQMIKLCYSGKYKEAELAKLLNGGSGFKAYFGTQDAKKISEMLDNGDELAREVTDALVYQTCKAIGEMIVACENPADRIIITGGMANFKYVTNSIVKRMSRFAPVEVLPGEFEMEALAEGALEVLTGAEEAKEYNVLPAGYSSEEEFYKAFKS